MAALPAAASPAADRPAAAGLTLEAPAAAKPAAALPVADGPTLEAPAVDVSVIVVNHNTKELCAQAVGAVRAAAQIASFEVVVVDNSTREQERMREDDVRGCSPLREDGALGCSLLRVGNNGFGHACNAGAAISRGRYLLFLNSDTILDGGSIDRAVAHMDADGEIGVLGIKTALADGSYDHASKRGFPTPANALCYFLGLDRRFPRCEAFGGYRLAYLDPERTADVDAVSGSFLMARRQPFDALGGFDEAYFMYGEDLDLCWRMKGAGYRVVYFAGASMRHLKGQSGLQADDPAVLGHFYCAMAIFYDKHLRRLYGPLMGVAVHAAILASCRRAMRRAKPPRPAPP